MPTPNEPDWEPLAASFTTTASESSTLTFADMMAAIDAMEERYPRQWAMPVHPNIWKREFNRLGRVPNG